MKKIQHNARVVSNEKICAQFYRLCLDAKPIAERALPGQFVHIRINEGLQPFFRRPFSIYRAKKYLEILYEVVGVGTRLLSEKKTGERLDILGPLGNSFSMPPDDVSRVVMIAGGVGVAPFLLLSDFLKSKKCRVTLLYGGRTKGHVYSMAAFKKNGCRVHIATDDGSVGARGRVAVLFKKIQPGNGDTMLYTCGPKPMMHSVQRFARMHNLACEASYEEVMACGLGACLGCSIKTTKGYKTVCHDGPVFDIQEIIW